MTNRVEVFEQMLEADPENTMVMFGLAKEYEKLGENKKVILILEQYLSRADDEGNAYGVLAAAYNRSGDREKAIEVYKKGIDVSMAHGHPSMANELQLVVRTAGSPEAMAGAVARKIRSLNPEIAIQTTTLETMVSDSVAMPRFRTFLVTTFAVVALLLAMAGVYGVMAYLVSQRTGELGLRMALGCAPGGVVRLVLARALAMAGAGLVAGIGLSFAGARLMAIFGVRPGDLGGYASAALAIVAVTLAAALAPAWRASRIDPAVALRGE